MFPTPARPGLAIGILAGLFLNIILMAVLTQLIWKIDFRQMK